MKRFLAFDLGAESGRAILGTLAGIRLELEELHRFANEPVRLPDGLYWDVLRLFHDIRQGLRNAGRGRQASLDGIGVDTWGVDFGLVDAFGELVLNPRHYRDARNNGTHESMCARMPQAEIFRHTGIQFMQLNSLNQLHAVERSGSPALRIASRLLFTPDLLSYWLCGMQANELTIASTSQFYNPTERRWSTEIFRALSLPESILGPIVEPGTKLGTLTHELQDDSGLNAAPVFATASHDTASAVAAVPATGARPWCYISSGTWSLMGVEIDHPVITEQSLKFNFTNEMGAGGKVRLLKNIAGLWLVQECRRAWALQGESHDYAELVAMAGVAEPFSAVLYPDAFLEPGHMPERIADYCRRTGQTAPSTPGQFVRVILESLALRYREVLEILETLSGERIEVIHIVGGGSKNALLNQLVADATAREVVAGPSEATAAGNILVQAMGAGLLDGLPALREVVRASFPLESFQAKGAAPKWDRAYENYLKIKSTA